MDAIIGMLGFLLYELSRLFMYVVFAWIILGWLLAFGIVSYRTPLVANIMGFCQALIDPLLNPIRRVIPPIGGLDITPIFLVLAIIALQNYVFWPMRAMGG